MAIGNKPAEQAGDEPGRFWRQAAQTIDIGGIEPAVHSGRNHHRRARARPGFPPSASAHQTGDRAAWHQSWIWPK